MKKWSLGILMAIASLVTYGQKNNLTNNHSLLWKISGNGLTKPSYLYGTIHMICKDDGILSDSLKEAIRNADDVYLEVDMDNLFEMIGAIKHMKMLGDTTLEDLLNKEDYEKVKNYFTKNSGGLPFSMMESFKPMLMESMIMENSSVCDETVVLEQVIMQEAKQNGKQIKGLETLAYQASLFDSIPYKLQADQLVKMVDSSGTGGDDKEYTEMLKAYKSQDLDALNKLMNSEDNTIPNFKKLLLDNRNQNWAKKLNDLMKDKSLVIAVGAGHLPGDEGVINLLRKQGYKVTPVKNIITKAREI